METYLPRNGPARLAGDGKGVASMSFVDAPTREAFPDGHILPIVDEVDVPPAAVPLWPILYPGLRTTGSGAGPPKFACRRRR